jgi:hypothetical protein
VKELERENARLRKAVSDLTLEKVVLKEAASEMYVRPSPARVELVITTAVASMYPASRE